MREKERENERQDTGDAAARGPHEPESNATESESESDSDSHGIASLDARLRLTEDELRAAVAERDRAKEELQRLYAVIASSEDAIIEKDLDGTIRSWNRGAEKIYGFTEEEAVGRAISLILPEGREKDVETILRRLREGEVLEGWEVERVRKDGEPVRMRLTLAPMRDGQGSIVGAASIGRDVTDRRLAEEALARSEQRLRLALEAGRMGYWELDLDTRQGWIDENLARLSGLPRDTREVDFSRWLDCVHREDRGAVLRAMRVAVDGEGDYASEFRIVHPDGTVRWLAGRGGIIPGEDGPGRGKRMRGVNFDITATKHAERRLAAIHALTRAFAEANTWEDAVPEILQALCHHLPAEVCELWADDPEAPGSVVCVHSHSTLGAKTPAAFVERGGGARFRPGEGLPGRVIAGARPIWLRADAATNESFAPPFATALGFPIMARNQVDAAITCFSRERQAEDPALLDMLAGIGRQLGEFRRRTEAERARRRSDDRFRRTLDTLVPFVGICTPAGMLVEANRSLLEAAALEPRDVLGKPFHESYWFTGSKETQEQVRRAMARAGAGRGSRCDIEIRIGDEAFVTLDFKIVPMLDERGEVSYLVCSGIDVTARKAAEKRLMNLNDELERRVAERTEKLERRTAMLQHLSRQLATVEQKERKRLARLLHDHLQQLVAAAKIRLDLLEDELTDTSNLEHVTSARENLEEAVSASRTLAAELSPPILETAALPETLKWLVRRTYEKHRLNVTLIEEEVPAVADEMKVFLFQAVRELIFNVVKHAKARSCTLRVSRAEGSRVRLTLEDDGIGFDPTSIGDEPEATGLGFLSVKERLEGMGGHLIIRSKPNEGTSIELLAPAIEEVEPGEVEGLTQPRADGPARRDSHPSASADAVRVLIVDDHRIVRQGLVSILSAKAGVEVAGEAQDGQEAIDLALALEPDVVLMDVDLPGVNGIEATRRIKARLPGARVIGLSIHEEEEVAQSMIAAGASDFITKGGHPERLLRRILEDPRGASPD